MMVQLLQIMAHGGLQSADDLARRLSVSLPMLEAVLDHLRRSGCLRLADAGCHGACQGCAVACAATSNPTRLWVLTKKGARLAGLD